MFETNIQNNTSLISLAKAAEITGYHQDYLGQLCRLGRLPAKKVGRNWFTTDEALRNFSTPINEAIEKEILDDEPEPAPAITSATPEIAQNYIVSQVEGLPISIRTLPTTVESTNTVQIIANNLRIQALQREVMELRELLTRLMNEVARHSELLGGRSPLDLLRSQESLRHNYVSNFDFNPPRNSGYELGDSGEIPTHSSDSVRIVQKEGFSVITWLAAAASLAALAYLGTAMATGILWGQPSSVTTVYYPPVVTDPVVAGAETSESTLNMLQ